METRGVEKFSPRWVGDGIRRLLNASLDLAADRLERARWVHLFNLAVFLIFVSLPFCIPQVSALFDIDLSQGRNLLTARYSESLGTILAVTAMGTMAFYLKVESLPVFGILGFGAGVCGLCFFPDNRFVPSPLSLTLNLALAFAIYLLFYFLRARFSARVLKWDFFFAAYASLAAGYLFESVLGFDLNWYFEINRVMFIFSLLGLEYQARRNASPQMEFAYIFSAMNVLTPVPVEAKDRVYSDKWRLRLRGLFDVVTGLVFLCWAIKIKTVFLNFPTDVTFAHLFVYGALNYFYYFLGSYAWIVLPVGIGRWFGMSLPDAFDLPLLSTSPADRWRRWNTYYYNWFYKVLFFPIFKKTKSLALALAAVTLGTLVVHAGALNYGLFLGDTSQLLTRNFILLTLLFSLHGIVLYVAIKFPRLFPSENSRWGWLGVALVMVLMSLIHVIAPK